ncbi:MAG: hypothetical protein CR977_00125 [Gammaproteobacteria bacterium]|nr:MAG: hypothetical protein CR977_00125 [Gammaproteobacteria bacterium]
MTKAFKNTVITGLQMFMTLSLPGRPSQDSIAATAKVWCELLAPLRRWDDDDIAALQRAFTAVARQATQWPAPRDIINNLDAKVTVSRALPRPPLSQADRDNITQLCANIRAQMQQAQTPTRVPTHVNIARTYDKD